MREFLKPLVTLPLALLLGCGHGPTASSPLALLAPLGPTRHITQKLRAEWPGGQADLLCVLELSNQAIAMAGLSSDGLSLFNLRYDGENLALEKNPLLPEYLPPELIVSDLQLIYWPAAELRKSLPSSWSLQTNTKQRILFHDTKIHAEVEYLAPETEWPRHVQLLNHTYHYQLTIDTVEYEAVPE